jgi:hypothetical protein
MVARLAVAPWLPLALIALVHVPVLAQEPAPGHEHHMPREASADPAFELPHGREGSGTSWLPDDTPMTGGMRSAGLWTVMWHGNVFLQHVAAFGDRGDRQTGSINWGMAMASRPLWQGRVGARLMMSAEPLTVGACGYPDLAQSGETCGDGPLRDRQHPHDLFMELTAIYRRVLARGVNFEAYGGPVGEPAIGPVAFPHRPSAMPNPIAGISHHWLDSTHIAFGVATVGLYGRHWKVETSAFNGREPDEHRYDFDLGPLDSRSMRAWWLPASRWALQASVARLKAVEPHIDDPDATRVTASVTYHRSRSSGRQLAAMVAWGQNREHGGVDDAFVAETAVGVSARGVIFGRFEAVEKPAGDLVPSMNDSGVSLSLAKTQVGYLRRLRRARGLDVSAGGSGAAVVLPRLARSRYGGRVSFELAAYLRLSPTPGE